MCVPPITQRTTPKLGAHAYTSTSARSLVHLRPLQVISPVIAIKSAPSHDRPVPRADFIMAIVYRASASAPPEPGAAPPQAPPASLPAAPEPACHTPKPPKGGDFELDDDVDAPLSSEATRRGSRSGSGSGGGASKRVSTRERLASAKRKSRSGAGGLASSDAITTTTLDGDVYQHLVETTVDPDAEAT